MRLESNAGFQEERDIRDLDCLLDMTPFYSGDTKFTLSICYVARVPERGWGRQDKWVQVSCAAGRPDSSVLPRGVLGKVGGGRGLSSSSSEWPGRKVGPGLREPPMFKAKSKMQIFVKSDFKDWFVKSLS